MKESRIKKVTVHIPDDFAQKSISHKVGKLHAEIIERKLNELPLTPREKIAVIDKIIENLKSQKLKV